MAEEGRRVRELMHGGVFKLHGGRQGIVHRGGGDFQIPGTDVGLVRWRLAGGPPEFREGTPIIELYGGTAKEGGGGTASVRNVLSGGCPGSITFWGEDLGLVGGDVLEYVGIAHGIPKADNKTEGKEAEGLDL